MSSSRGALFGNSSSRSQNKNLVEFKAGKMTQKGKMVHPDKRKGLIYVYQSEDSLMHFCWKDRHSGTVEDDLIIFPDDCEYKRITQCTTGRVYILKFKSSVRRFFFWMQDPKTDKDDENCKRLNEMLNNPPTPGSQRSGGGTPDGDLQSLLNTMSQQQLMQFFGNVGQFGNLSSLLGPVSGTRQVSSSRSSSGGSPAVSTGGTASSGGGSKSGSVTAASESAAPKSDSPAAEAGAAGPSVDLSSALTTESLQAMLAEPSVVRELQQHLPVLGDLGSPSAGETEQLRSTLQSPQFQQALSMFSAALQSGQLGPVVQQFEVGTEAVTAANQGDLEQFVRALQRAGREEGDGNKESQPEPSQDKDDESMD